MTGGKRKGPTRVGLQLHVRNAEEYPAYRSDLIGEGGNTDQWRHFSQSLEV